MDVLPELSPILQKYLLLQWVVAYPADLDIFEMWPLEREFPENNWENPRIYLDIPDFDYITLEEKFTSLFAFAFDHSQDIHYKCFSDPKFNEHGDYMLGYVSIKLSNEFLKEMLIETAYLNGYGYRVVEGFLFE